MAQIEQIFLCFFCAIREICGLIKTIIRTAAQTKFSCILAGMVQSASAERSTLRSDYSNKGKGLKNESNAC
jgi:hypothetical protein